MRTVSNLTAERLREIFVYDERYGVFSRRPGRFDMRKVGCVAPNGYLVIRVDGILYLAHRLAWLHVHGEWPESEIDHVDGCRLNNRLANLRLASRKKNSENIRKARTNNKLGILGVCVYRGKFSASITQNGKHIFLGYHDTKEGAHDAYLKAKRRLHEGCTL